MTKFNPNNIFLGLIWVVLLILLPLQLSAQVQVVVGLNPDNSQQIKAVLSGDASKQQASNPALFDEVIQSERLFSQLNLNQTLQSVFTLTVADSAALKRTIDLWKAQPNVRYAQPVRYFNVDGLNQPDNDEIKACTLSAAEVHMSWAECAFRLRSRYIPGETSDNGKHDYFQITAESDSLDHHAVLNVAQAWEITRGNKDVVIGVLDTGMDFSHPAFVGQFWINPEEDLNGNGQFDLSDFDGIDNDGNGFVDDIRGYDFVNRPASVEPGDYQFRDNDPSDDPINLSGGRGHGTLVAGVIAASDTENGLYGIAPACKIYPLRAFGADGAGQDIDVAAAIIYAADLDIDVLNMSFGDRYRSPVVVDALEYATEKGLIAVGSAGNSGGEAPHYPSDYSTVISTVWLSSDGTRLGSRASHGAGVAIGAPGTRTFTTVFPTENNPDLWARKSGSSLSAPMVSATAGLIRSIDQTLSPAAIRAIITGSATDILTEGWDNKSGAGLLNVRAAVERALPANISFISPKHDSGTDQNQVVLTGTVLHPQFTSWQVFWHAGDEDLDDIDEWQPINQPVSTQILEDTLSIWDISALQDSVYVIRLSVTLQSGQQIEDRRRIIIDRTNPEIISSWIGAGLQENRVGVWAEIESDDFVEVWMEVVVASDTFITQSDRNAHVHGVFWENDDPNLAEVNARLKIQNRSSLTTFTDWQTIDVRLPNINPILFEAQNTNMPQGFIMPKASDFDGDGLLEVTFNQYQGGFLGDTLVTVEWNGDGFTPAAAVIANVFPRSTGDPDGDGLQEVLGQVLGATLVLEQANSTAYPNLLSYVDTVGLIDPFNTNALYGARLADLDQDGKGEIIGHNTTEYRILEHNGVSYAEVARLVNPTNVTGELSQNIFEQPRVLIDDFDADGKMDLLVADADGDWMIFENTADDTYEVVWQYETDWYGAAGRMTKGDFDGDGVQEFWVYAGNWPSQRLDREHDPPAGHYFMFNATGDNQYELVDSLTVATNLSRHGSMASGDFDGDGKDELILAHAPGLYVFDTENHAEMIWYAGQDMTEANLGNESTGSGSRSTEMLMADFTGAGSPQILVSWADGTMQLHQYHPNEAGQIIAQWDKSIAIDQNTVFLSWNVIGSDSVSIFRRSDSLDPYTKIITTEADQFTDLITGTFDYTIAAWSAGGMQSLNQSRKVRTHNPATLIETTFIASNRIELVFSEALNLDNATQKIRFASDIGIETIASGQNGKSIIIKIDANLISVSDTLYLDQFEDVEGTPIADAVIPFTWPAGGNQNLILTEWEIIDKTTVRLKFSASIDQLSAENVDAYEVLPTGTVTAAVYDVQNPDQVTLTLETQALGATGLSTSVKVISLTDVNGNSINPDGNTASFAGFADDLSGVYIFPNPWRASQHQNQIIVAGLPQTAEISIYSVNGVFIRRLTETNGDGGVIFDLKDENGTALPSGVYLFRVTSEGETPVITKLALIR